MRHNTSIFAKALLFLLIFLASLPLISCAKYKHIEPEAYNLTYAYTDENGEPLTDENNMLITREINVANCSREELRLFHVLDYENSFGEITSAKAAYEAAMTVFKETYRSDCDKTETPFNVFYNPTANAWLVFGTLDVNTVGGTAKIAFASETGEVLMLFHDK